MDLQMNIALSTLQMAPNERPENSVDSVAAWLREKSKVFKQLDETILTDVAKNCSLQMLPADYVLIRQGEIGDCFYIVLGGQVSVYICTDLEPGQVAGIKPEKSKGDDDIFSKKTSSTTKEMKDDKLDRKLFGKHIVNLGMGASFGELALINDDCIRNASIILEEPSNLICIDRDLYNRSLKGFQKRDFEDRNNFIETHPLFSQWPWRLKRQVAMSLERSFFDFDSLISKQGKPANAIYFIFKGTARLVFSSSILNVSTGGSVPRPSIQYNVGSNKEVEFRRRSGSLSLNSTIKHEDLQPRQVEMCMITNGEAVGDLEMLYPLDYYLFTTIAATSTEVLSLSQKNVARFLENKSISKMMVDLLSHAYYRLKDRVERIKCPNLASIFNHVSQIVSHAEAKRATELQNRMKHRVGRKNDGHKPKTPSTPSGHLTVSPPTVAFRRFITRGDDDDTTLQFSRQNSNIEGQNIEIEDAPEEAKETVFPDWETSDKRLTELEERIRKFNTEFPLTSEPLMPAIKPRAAPVDSGPKGKVVEMRRYTVSGIQGAPRAGTLIKVRVSNAKGRSRSPSPPPSSLGGRMSNNNGSHYHMPTTPSFNSRNVTFSREVSFQPIDELDDKQLALERQRSFSVSTSLKKPTQH